MISSAVKKSLGKLTIARQGAKLITTLSIQEGMVSQLLQEVLVLAAPPTVVEPQLARRSATMSMLEGVRGQTAPTSMCSHSQAVERLVLPAIPTVTT